MKNLGDWLRSQGIKSRDLREAVEDARTVTERVHIGASLVESGLSKLAAKPNMGKKARGLVVLGVKVASSVRKGAADMLRERKR